MTKINRLEREYAALSKLRRRLAGPEERQRILGHLEGALPWVVATSED